MELELRSSIPSVNNQLPMKMMKGAMRTRTMQSNHMLQCIQLSCESCINNSVSTLKRESLGTVDPSKSYRSQGINSQEAGIKHIPRQG